MKKIALIVLGLVLVYVALDAWNSHQTERNTRNYHGVGQLVLMPYYGILRGGGGYRIHFDRFKLTNSTNVTYHFSGLPPWKVNIFFAIVGQKDWQWRKQVNGNINPVHGDGKEVGIIDDLKGTIRVSLKEEGRGVVFNYERKLCDLVWSRAGVGPWELYNPDLASLFIPKSQAQYVLEVNVDPDDALKDNEGYILFRSGGNEAFSIGFN